MNLILLNTNERGPGVLDDAYVRIAMSLSELGFRPSYVAFCLTLSEVGVDVGYGQVLYGSCAINPVMRASVNDVAHVKERALQEVFKEYNSRVHEQHRVLVARRADEDLFKKLFAK